MFIESRRHTNKKERAQEGKIPKERRIKGKESVIVDRSFEEFVS